MKASTGALAVDKALLNQALAALAQPLGLDPVQAALDIVAETQAQLQKPQLAEKYLMPYVERIAKQQKESRK